MLDADFDSVVSDLWRRFILTIFKLELFFSGSAERVEAGAQNGEQGQGAQEETALHHVRQRSGKQKTCICVEAFKVMSTCCLSLN